MRTLPIILAITIPFLLIMLAFAWGNQAYFTHLLKSEQMAPQFFEKVLAAEMV